MNRNTPAMPTISALTPLSMLSRPRLGPTARSSIGYSGIASDPERSSSASSRASPAASPLIWKLLANTPRMVASLVTSSSVTSRFTFLPLTSLTSRRLSLSPTAIFLLRVARPLEHAHDHTSEPPQKDGGGADREAPRGERGQRQEGESRGDR